MKNVYFSSLKSDHFNTPFDVIQKLSDIVVGNDFDKGDHVALKIHFGEFGRFNYIKPQYLFPPDLRFKINKRCVGCGCCIKTCAHNAIEGKKATITEKCVGCGNFLLACGKNAIRPDFSTKGDDFLTKLVEYAYVAVKHKVGKMLFVNFLTNISSVCDCVNYTPELLMNDIVIIASDDPVACDQASIDLLNAHNPGNYDIIKEIYPDINYELDLTYAEEIGLGMRKYQLVDISKDAEVEQLSKLVKVAQKNHKNA